MLRSYSNLGCFNILNINVSLARRLFESGSRPRRRDTFRYENPPWFSPCGPASWLFKFAPGEFVLRQRKVSKRKAARLPLASCAPRFCRGSAEGAPAPLLTCGIPAAPLTGCSRQKLRCSARQTGLNSCHWQVSIAI
jgi:hypothetical protein